MTDRSARGRVRQDCDEFGHWIRQQIGKCVVSLGDRLHIHGVIMTHRYRDALALTSMKDNVEALAVYGSLVPGEKNHWVLSRIKGTWKTGSVRGHTFEITWGPAEGYDGFIPDPDGSDVEVYVLESEDLDKNWREIDDFEGSGYERMSIDVAMAGGLIRQANIYVALTDV